MAIKSSFRYFRHKNRIYRQDTVLTTGGNYVVVGPAILYKACINDKEAIEFFNSLLLRPKILKGRDN